MQRVFRSCLEPATRGCCTGLLPSSQHASPKRTRGMHRGEPGFPLSVLFLLTPLHSSWACYALRAAVLSFDLGKAAYNFHLCYLFIKHEQCW